jgi:alkylation response protein AidB-like acyl-CoA dehydrogenase
VDLRYAAEHAILRESADKFLHERYDYRTVQKIAASDTGWNREIWAEFAKLGWLGLPFAPEDGGDGGGAVELAILMEAFGKRLVLEPYLPTVVLGGGLIAALGSPAERQSMLPSVTQGRCHLAFAHEERDVPTQAQRTSRGYLLREERRSFSAARARRHCWSRRGSASRGWEFSSCPGRRAASPCGPIAWWMAGARPTWTSPTSR